MIKPPRKDTTEKGNTPSRVISRPDELEGGEETEITTQFSVPEEGGWGWVVVVASFLSIMILDGVCFTFGSLIQDMKKDFAATDSQIAFVNSLAVALYFLLGPLSSACINRFGFRSCCMAGSVIVSCSLLCSYFTTRYSTLCFFYGGCAGVGYSFVNLSCALVAGFYFDKLRSFTLSTAATGSSVGIAVISPINTYLVSIAGWRVTTLFHTGFFGLIYFLGMTYKPLLSLSVVKTTEGTTRTVAYLPKLASVTPSISSRITVGGGLMPTATERLFSAVSNANFPTAASIIDESKLSTPTQPGPSKASAVSKLTLTAHTSQRGISRRQLKQVQSIISRTSAQDRITVNVQEPMGSREKASCWQRLCHWEEHIPASRPMYRDDAFYSGKIENLPEYQKSMMDTTAENKTGLEYQLAVSRALTADDLKETGGVFTTAARRVLATMVDPKLLKRKSFLLLSCSGFLVYLGTLVPYVYIQDRNKSAGIDISHCNMFVTVIGTANAIGRMVMGVLASKIDPLKLYTLALCVSGISTILSTMSYSVYYQYGYCAIFGFFISSFASLRSMVVVSRYGLDKLTNATGLLLLFQGCGSLISTPMAGTLKYHYDYDISFIVAGIFILCGGLISCPVGKLSNKENMLQINIKTKMRKS